MRYPLANLPGFLEREAGRVCIGFVLIFVGGAFCKLGVPKGEDIIIFALGLLATVMQAGRRSTTDWAAAAPPVADHGTSGPTSS